MLKTKIWLTVAGILFSVGAIVFTVVLASCGWNLSELSKTSYETNTHEIDESFSNISIDVVSADIKILSSDDENCKIVCFKDKEKNYQMEVANGTLTITEETKWYEHIFSFGQSPKITLYLPKSEYSELLAKSDTGDMEIGKNILFEQIDISATTGDITCFASAKGLLKIDLTTGDIELSDLTAGAVELTLTSGEADISSLSVLNDFYLKTTTGDAELKKVYSKNFFSEGVSGEIFLEDVITEELFTVKRTTGDITFKDCDAKELYIKTTTADVEGSLLSDKIFKVNTTTGDKNVPNTNTGGICTIECTTGDIDIRISK